MRHLNYNHLLYFHTVAREGSIAKASEVLHITPQTISGQLKLLDRLRGRQRRMPQTRSVADEIMANPFGKNLHE